MNTATVDLWETDQDGQHGSYRLNELHVYNWGAFQGWHMAALDARNTAIIGPTGSGKTTVIDALMTLLCANPKYNLASTGGHESDRDLVSYVRGASGPGMAGSSEHISRSGKTVTGIAARLLRPPSVPGGSPEQVWLGALFWFDGSSSAVTDLNRRWLFAEGVDQSLNFWLEEHHRGGARALAKLAKDTDGLSVHTAKSAYLAKLQSHFEVGANAFTLLNRAAGLKQLNSIDEIFRELVLEDRAAFDEALQVAAGFDELTSIHADLELANRQYAALLPLRELDEKYAAQQAKCQDVQAVDVALPRWFAMQGQALWAERARTLRQQTEALQTELDAASAAVDAASHHEQTLLELYLQAGGSSIEDLQGHIASLNRERGQRQRNAAQYQTLLRNLALPVPPVPSAAVLAEQQTQAGEAQAAIARQLQEHAAELEVAIAQAHNAQAEQQRLHTELEQTRKRPGSNIPPQFQRFRAELAEQLELNHAQLPFVAELVEVQKQHQAWRGAIERALGSQRLRILVPPDAIRTALQWVNQRHNHLHVRLLEACEPATAPRFFDDGFCSMLTLKPHDHGGALRQLLAEHDRHCVDNAAALQRTPHAMTQQGLMSGKARHFDKQDQKRLQDDWLTGFDNRDRLAMLTAQWQDATRQAQQLALDKEKAQRKHAQLSAASALWDTLRGLQFEQLDVAGVSAECDAQQQRLDALLHPQSGAARAKAEWLKGKGATKQCRERHGVLDRQHAVATQTLDQATAEQQRHAARLGEGEAMPPSIDAQLAGWLPLQCETIDQTEREAARELQKQLIAEREQLTKLENAIVRQMAKARQENLGAMANEVDELDAMPTFLARLRLLQEEALPEKRQRFQTYLNESSEQGVNGLISGIDAQVTEIRDRIDELNATLLKVDFQPGRYLQLQSQDENYPVIRTLHALMAELRSARHRDDGGQAHYTALSGIVTLLREHAGSRRNKSSQALLDPRYRLGFAVAVHDRASGQVLERRTGSQGGSGGEKEIIASYVLTASLSYALCPPGRSRPVFGTIVLDEAFSKSSQAVAGRIIEALREFGLHALFVTPNKEVRLLRNHTRSAVVVHRRGSHASLTSLAWEELDRARPGNPSNPLKAP